jgi:V8-like Glu-specific endopeptidase
VRRGLGALMIGACLAVATVQPAAAIVYGDFDGPNHPNVGSMLVEDGSDTYQWCSGTLIAKGVFLTAAHCTVALSDYGFSIEDVRVTFDSRGVSGPIEVTGLYEDPRYNHRQANPYDLAVLYLDTDATLPVPAKVAGPGYLDAVGKKALRKDQFTAVGYGAVRTSKKKGPQGILDNMQRNSAIQSMQSLTSAWLTLAMNDRSVENGGTCFGDSGGPHFDKKDVLVSITVTGDSVCKATDRTYRIDTPWAQDFLEDALPG